MKALVALVLALAFAVTLTPAAAQAPCDFKLGFKLIADQIPDRVGPCLENEWFNTDNGNAEQRTAAHHGQGGLLVWRKADNWTAFTDGHWSWVNGPYGLMQRLNSERFSWEAAEPAAAAPPAPAAPSARKSATVSRVVDGDTLDIVLDGATTRVRVIGVNTPETVDPRRSVECFGREASARAKVLLPLGAVVQVEGDPSQDARDRFGRSLLYVYLPDGRSLGDTLIREGFAHEYTFQTPYRDQAQHRAAQADARAAQRGLWAPDACAATVEAPPAPAAAATSGKAAPIGPGRCPDSHSIKGNQGSRSTTEWIYHVRGGRSYDATDPEECFARPQDAEAAGYRAALR